MSGREWLSIPGALMVLLAFGAFMQLFATPSVVGVVTVAAMAGIAWTLLWASQTGNPARR